MNRGTAEETLQELKERLENSELLEATFFKDMSISRILLDLRLVIFFVFFQCAEVKVMGKSFTRP